MAVLNLTLIITIFILVAFCFNAPIEASTVEYNIENYSNPQRRGKIVSQQFRCCYQHCQIIVSLNPCLCRISFPCLIKFIHEMDAEVSPVLAA